MAAVPPWELIYKYTMHQTTAKNRSNMYMIYVYVHVMRTLVPSFEINSLQQYLWAAIELNNMNRDIYGNFIYNPFVLT